MTCYYVWIDIVQLGCDHARDGITLGVNSLGKSPWNLLEGSMSRNVSKSRTRICNRGSYCQANEMISDLHEGSSVHVSGQSISQQLIQHPHQQPYGLVQPAEEHVSHLPPIP